MLARSGEITAPWPVPLSLPTTTPSSRTPAVSHFRIRRDDARVADPVLHEPDQPFLAQRVEERLDVGVQYEVHFPARNSDTESIERIVRSPPWTEPVREPEEVLLVDLVQ